MTTETDALLIERNIALQVVVGDPEPISVEDAAVLVAEIRRLRAAIQSARAAEARVRAVCKPDLDWSERSGEDLPLWVTEVLRACDGET